MNSTINSVTNIHFLSDTDDAISSFVSSLNSHQMPLSLPHLRKMPKVASKCATVCSEIARVNINNVEEHKMTFTNETVKI